MRITSGRHKGRILKIPKGIRPTQEKVRKAVFDILGDVEGVSFLELYAGSGAVGLEALSRGVKDLTMVEYNRDCQMAIKKNIQSLQARSCRIYPKDSLKAVKQLFEEGRRFDVIFLDPPYYRDQTKKTLQALSLYDILADTGLVIVQHFKKENLPEQLGVLNLFRQSTYGDTVLSFYKRKEAL